MDGDIIPAGELTTQPSAKIVFNAPFDQRRFYRINLDNSGGRRIGWVAMSTSGHRISIDPPFGAVDPDEPILMAVWCEAFAIDQEDINDDHITIAWVNTPHGATMLCRPEWFLGDEMVHCKNLPIEYNV